jgi:hypothetical protein
MYYGWPAVEANKNFDAVLVYARSSEQIYPQIRFSAYLNNEDDIRPSRLLKNGEATYDYGTGSPLRWGDLAGASVDPKDDTAIWIVHQYARSSASANNWGIWVGKVFGIVYLDWYFKEFAATQEANAGGEFHFSGELANGGDGDAPTARVHVDLLGDRRRVGLGSFGVPALAAGATARFEQSVRLPRNLTPGDYVVRLSVDSRPEAEYSAANNTVEAALRVLSP